MFQDEKLYSSVCIYPLPLKSVFHLFRGTVAVNHFQARLSTCLLPCEVQAATAHRRSALYTRCRGAPWRTIPSSSFVCLFYKGR
jgi:hypothetical protein